MTASRVLFVLTTASRYVVRRQQHHMVLPADTFEGKIIPKARGRLIHEPERPAKYGGRFIVTMLPGPAPGPKFMSYVKDIFQTALVPIDFEEITEEMTNFEELAVTAMHRNGVGLKGNIHAPDFGGLINLTLRDELDLYICVVHINGYQYVKCKHPNLDIYICRQNTESVYRLLEHSAIPGVVESLRIITRENTSRVAEWCFEFAKREKRKKVTIIHKANALKTDALFVQAATDVAKKYPEIEVNDMIVDAATMQLVQNPTQFDVILTLNLYGSILSNIACGLIGGASLMSAQNFGPNNALFEAASRHLTSSEEENLNPVAMLNASIDLLNYLRQIKHAHLIRKAVRKTLSEDKIHTPDIGGSNTTDELLDSIKNNIKDSLKTSTIKLF